MSLEEKKTTMRLIPFKDEILQIFPPKQQLLSNKTRKQQDVPIDKKELLTLEEAAAYTGIGINKLRELSNDEDCEFVLWNSSKRLLKRRKLENYLSEKYSI